jgi:endonuclease YncB( thermonuclease family)
MGAVVLTLLVGAGCTQTASAPTTTLGQLRTIDIYPPTTTTTVVPPTIFANGYVNNVIDGRTFDIQTTEAGQATKRGLTVAYIQVPPIGTCEGGEARNLLAALIFGKKVTIDPAGLTFLDDLDVGLTMIQYGMATPTADAPGYYIENSKLATPLNCANTTTTTVVVQIVVPPQPKATPKPTTKPKPKRTVPPVTDEPVAEPVETAPPPVAEPPVATDPPARATDPPPPAETQPEHTKKTKPDKPDESAPETPAPPASG